MMNKLIENLPDVIRVTQRLLTFSGLLALTVVIWYLIIITIIGV